MGATVSSISADKPFALTLAHHLLEEFAGDPAALSRVTILLPTRRAILALREAFLAAAPGQALILPAMAALGDVGEEETAEDLTFGIANHTARVDELPAIGEFQRLSLLTKLVYQRLKADRPLLEQPPLDQAARLAEELARLMDRVQTAGLDFAALEGLVPDIQNLAEHWQESLRFLSIVTERWPEVLTDLGCQDAAERRRRTTLALADAWATNPPNQPIIAAGSTGSVPATRVLLQTIAYLPQGQVILPGLDMSGDDEAWAAIGADPTHPQYGLHELLGAIAVVRGEVAQIGPACDPAGGHRQQMLSLAMRPASVSDSWVDEEGNLDPAATKNTTLIECEHAGEEAMVIALLLREVLEQPDKTAALVTPDRALAKRVSSLVARWGIAIDDSAGMPLGQTPVGIFLRALAEFVARPSDAVALMALLKHPLARGGFSAAEFGTHVRQLDLALRDDLAGTPLKILAEQDNGWARSIIEILQPLITLADEQATALTITLALHMQSAESLAGDESLPGAERLWAGDDGVAAAQFINDLSGALDRLPDADFHNYAGLFETMMAGQTVRYRRPAHPRLSILGPLEARLQTPDRIILAGLNEGTWPRDPAPDPWMSLDMQKKFGLPAPQRVVGLAAHDFVQSFAADEVFLTRAQRVDGLATQPSRFLRRLGTVLQGVGLEPLDADSATWLALARSIDHEPDNTPTPQPPAPKPPAYARPSVLTQTDIGNLMRDPYAVYAKRILHLSALRPLASIPGAPERGTILHRLLADQLKALGARPVTAEAADRLHNAVEPALEALGDHANVETFWTHRFHRAIDWMVDHESLERDEAWRWHALEADLEAVIEGVTIKARADRIDFHPEHGLTIIDYKSGSVPTKKDVERGFEPQLPIELLLLAYSEDATLRHCSAHSLEYWRMNGGRVPGDDFPQDPPDKLLALAQEGLPALLAWFADANTPYLSQVWPTGFGDYDHLARIGEWSPQDWQPE